MTVTLSTSKPPSESLASLQAVVSTATPAEAGDLAYSRMPPKRVNVMRVRYVHRGKGTPRPYQLDD